jgi:hypothetical protein
MKVFGKILSMATVALLAVGVGTAAADVFVTGTVTKTKTKKVQEFVTISKNVNVKVDVKPTLDAAVESEVIKNQRNEFHCQSKVTCDNPNFTTSGSFVDNSDSAASISGAVAGVNGVVQINQSPGNINNQANEGSVVSGSNTATFVHSEVSVEQVNQVNDVVANTVTNSTLITGPGTLGVAGIAQVNQSAGDLNNQNNSLSAALSDNGAVALSEVDLGQFNTAQLVDLTAVNRTDTINADALDGYSGVVLINQSSGYANNQANLVSLAVDTGVAQAFTP